MEECYYIDKYGAIKINKLKGLSVLYLELKCVLDNKSNIGLMYYPLIVASTDAKYLAQIKLALRASKDGIKYIPTTEKYTSDEYQIVYYKKDIHRSKAILYSYILKEYYHLTKQDFDPTLYIFNDLQGHPDYNKRVFMSRYINHVLPDILPKEIEKIYYESKLSPKEKYMARYKLAQKYDNFETFNKMYEKVAKDASELLNKVKKNPKFIVYSKNIKTHNFKFSIKDSIGKNPMYKNVASAVKTYAKSLKIKI